MRPSTTASATPESSPRRVRQGGGAAWLRPLNAFVRTAGSLVAAEVGHGLVQARVTDVTGQVPYPLCCDVSFSFAGVHSCASRCNHAFSHQNPRPCVCFSYASRSMFLFSSRSP